MLLLGYLFTNQGLKTIIHYEEKIMNGMSLKFVESILQKIVSGKLTSRKGASRLGVSRHYVYRLLRRYGQEGAGCLIHGNTGRGHGRQTQRQKAR